MTLDKLRPYIAGMLDPFVTGFDRIGISPDGVSFLAFGMAVAAGAAFTLGGQVNEAWFVLAGVFVFLNGWLDLIDGALAKQKNLDSPSGDLLDHVLDRYADIVIVAGIAGAVGDFVLGFAAVTGIVMTSYLGTQAQAVGLSRVYGGLVGRADRLAIIGVSAIAAFLIDGTLWSLSLLGWLLVFLAVIGHLTAIQRFWYANRSLST